MQKLLISFLLTIVFVLPFTHRALAEGGKNYKQADIYYNEACGGCNIYLKEKLVPFLEEQGITVDMHDYVNDVSVRQDMNKRQEVLSIPFQYQSHIMTFIDDGELVINQGEQVLTGDEGGISAGYGGILIAEGGKIHGNQTKLMEVLK